MKHLVTLSRCWSGHHVIDDNISSFSIFSGIWSLNRMPSAILSKYSLNILATVSDSLIIESSSRSKYIYIGIMPRANKWLDSRLEMLIFLPSSHRSVKYCFFDIFSVIDTLVFEDSVPFIIFRAMMFIFDITQHVPFIHNFPPFTRPGHWGKMKHL